MRALEATLRVETHRLHQLLYAALEESDAGRRPARMDALRAEVRRLEGSDRTGGELVDRLRRSLGSSEPLLGEALLHHYLASIATLQAYGEKAPPLIPFAVADLLHLENRLPLGHRDLLERFSHSLVPGSRWYRKYVLARADAIADRIRRSDPSVALALLEIVDVAMATGRRHVRALERALLAALENPDATVRSVVVGWLIPRGGNSFPPLHPLYRSSDALQARLHAMLSDPDRSIRDLLYIRQVRLSPSFGADDTALGGLIAGDERLADSRSRWRVFSTRYRRPEAFTSESERTRLLSILLEDPSEPIRWEAAQRLHEHRQADARFLPALLRAVHDDPSAAVRRAIAGRLDLSRAEDPRISPALARAYVQRRIPDRSEGWSCADVYTYE